MKAFSLLMAGLAVAASASAADFYAIGDFNGWTLADPATKFTETATSGVYEVTLEKPVEGFKINDGSWSGTYNLGVQTAGAIQTLGTPISLWNNRDSKDIKFASPVNNAKVVLDINALTVTVTGDEVTDVTYSYALHGNWDGSTAWSSLNMANQDGVWTFAKLVVKDCNFGIKKINDATGNQAVWYSSAETSPVVVVDTPMAVKENGTNFSLAAGEYSFSFDPENLTLTVTEVGGGEDPDPVDPDDPDTRVLYIVGECNNWSVDDAYKMIANGNVYTVELANGLEGMWKIWDGTWQYSFGPGSDALTNDTDVEVWFNSSANFNTRFTGKTVVTLTVVAGSDEENSSIPAILRVEAEGEEEEPTEHELYIVGECNGWVKDEAYKMTRNDNVYTIELTNGLAGSWKIWDGSWSYSFGAGAEGTVTAGENIEVWFNSTADLSSSFEGTVKVTLTVAEGSDKGGSSIPAILYVENTTTGVEGVEAESAEVVYFNMQGVRVANPTEGLYIKVQGNKTEKVAL